MKIENILNDGIGHIELLDWMGGDLASVNGARASYATRKDKFDDKDARLLERLGNDYHHTPLRHTYFQFYVEAPEYVARQWYKHVVGCEYAFKDLPWSEFSQRYKEVKPQFYVPDVVRVQSLHNKQASEPCGDSGLTFTVREAIGWTIAEAWETYDGLIRLGVAREQARIVLPLATYTSFVWTASIQAVVHFCTLRDEPGAQFEIQAYAKALRSLCYDKAPVTWDALEASHPLKLRGQP